MSRHIEGVELVLARACSCFDYPELVATLHVVQCPEIVLYPGDF